MRPRIRLGVIWSLEELQKLINDENSCVCMERSRKHVALHPIHLNNLNKAFQDILDSSINVYDSQFKGLLLAYKNPKLISELGTILYDSHFIHVDIEADFYIFRPELQRVLSGVVNKKADNYIGVLIHKVFNVSITKTEEEENWRGDHLKVGDDVTFTIQHVDLKGKLPFIRGKLLSNGTLTRIIPSTATSHTFFNSDEELDHDDTTNALETVNENNKINKSKHRSFLNSTNSDSSDEEAQTENEIVKDDKYSKSLESHSQDEEQVYEKQSSFESTSTTHDEDEYNSAMLNGTDKSKKSSKKDKKKSSKDKDHHIEDKNNILHYDSTCNESENTSITENEMPTKKSKKRKYENTEESSSSELLPKIRKHKKKHKTPEVDEHYISHEEEKVFSTDNEMKTSRMLVEEETIRKSSKKKHKEKIKVEQNDERADFNNTESKFTSSSSDIDHSRDSTQEERPSKSSKKSSKHKSKSKQKIKEEQPDTPTYSEHQEEYNQTLETEYETNRSTELLQIENNQTDVSSHNYSDNNTDISQNFTEFEMPIKSKKKKKKRSSNGDDFLDVKIKEEPVSDVESSSSKKSKRKRKDRENDSFNNLDSETSETDNSQNRKQKNKEKEPVDEVSVGKIKVKQEVVIKEESSKKKKHKEGNQSTLNIKQESTSSDVEGTAVKKKIKTLFTE